MSEAKKTDRSPNSRPISPSLVGGKYIFFWRWHLTLYASILHRLTGMALYLGAILVTGWVLSLASGAKAYAWYVTLLGSPLGKLVMLVLTFSVFYHMANGVRHLVWDSGKGFELKVANNTAVAVIAFGVAATTVVWIIVQL